MVEKPGLRAARGGKTAALAWMDSDRFDNVRPVFDRSSALSDLAKTVPIPSLGELLAACGRSCGVTGHSLLADSVRDASTISVASPDY
jgi:hypothetical protein